MLLNTFIIDNSSIILVYLCLIVFSCVYIIINNSITNIIYTKHLNTIFYMVAWEIKKTHMNLCKNLVFFYPLYNTQHIFVFLCLVSLQLTNALNIIKHKMPTDSEQKMFSFLTVLIGDGL